MAERLIEVPAGTYTIHADGGTSQVTVPTLTAGAIDQSSPNPGDTLTCTVSASNASGGPTTVYSWQVDTGSGFVPAGGTNNAADYDTIGQPDGAYRRGVSDGSQGPVYTDPVTLAQTIAISEEADGTITINGDGSATIEITSPAEYVGTYELTEAQVSNLDTTPVNLVAATVTGNDPGTVGDSYALLHPGLWAYDGTEPTATYQWQLGGVNVSGQTDPAGYTTTTAGDVCLKETYGEQTAHSAAVTVEAAPAMTVSTVLAWSSDANTTNYTRPALDLSAGTEFMVVVACKPSVNGKFTSAMLGNQPGTLITDGVTVADAYTGMQEFAQIWKFTSVLASGGDLVLTDGLSTSRRLSAALFQVAGESVAKLTILEAAGGTTHTITADVLNGDVAIVGAVREFDAEPLDPIVGFTALQNVTQSNRPTCVGRHDATANEPGRSFSTTGDNRRGSMVVAVLRAA